MNSNKSYIFKNIYGNMYEFYINKDNSLMCNKFSEETKILENVLKFNINVTYLGVIEVVCITFDGFIKYCKFNKKWSIQTLYKLKSHNNNIDEANLFSKGNKLHIFFMFYENKYDSRGNILHYVWNGNKFKTNIIGPINTIDGVEKHYNLETLNNTINMFYITKEKNSHVINLCKFLNNDGWSSPKKLYRLDGNNINFSTLKKDKQFNILNLSEENGIYTLEHVTIDIKDNINNFPIYKTNNTIYKSTLIIFNDILYCVWSENNKLMYSSFNGTKWSNCYKIDTKSFDNIDMYKYIYEESPLDKSIESKNIFASISDNINVFLPKVTKTYNNNNKYDAESTIKKLLQDISKKNTVNYDLMNKTISLTEKLKEKNLHVNNLIENLNKISIQKSNIESKYNSLLETNNKLNIQTEDFKEKLNNENKNNELIKIKLKEKIDENENLNNIIQKLQNENITTIKNLDDKYLIKIKNIKKQLEDKENQLKDLLDKNKSLEKNIKELKLENDNANEKLEKYRKNILSNFKNKYDIEVSTIKKQLEEKEKSFQYITDYSQELEATLNELKSENSLIKQQLENSKNKNFIEKIFGRS
ncbi:MULTISPECIES: hypothetical protein [Clostridium]|uniref:Uncharacterized protein n=5 Tax=Clostridium TaxID=1485 RepID=A0A7X5SZW3_CLOSG|nr:hypothetical protein [Clostridium sporogenes]AJD29647.1 hypothetical protein T258_1967 [Clostridium botulinum Prevot_594]AVP62532.1 hypothetical protein C7M79_18345 [Clostridium botulinum]AKC63941.1 hypothetical protein CLSPO_c32230 [Clostridium sporogenes]AKJ91082.1 hypothetical protein CLSPOx_16130 [Clostridium sporogenes]AVP66232.1 hypothetical protein C3B64_19075 [Clostridium botulinum]